MGTTKANLVKELVKEFQIIYTCLYEHKYIIEHKEFSYTREKEETEKLTWSTRSSEANITFDTGLDIDTILFSLLKSEQFSLLFYDRSILQVEYTLKNNSIIKQRIQYIKRTNIINSFDDLEFFEGSGGSIEGGSVFEDETGIPVFLRIDYDPCSHDELFHSKSHFVISNLKDCRIPINKNVTLTRFIEFLLHQVYNDYSIEFKRPYENEIEITEREQNYFHICS